MSTQLKSYQFFKKLCQLKFVDEIWLFGSRARGDNEERSDIDLAIICPSANRTDWNLVTDIVNNADTFLKIDCIRFEKNTLTPEFYQNILKDKKVLYMKEFAWKDNFYTLGNAISRLKDVLSHSQINELDYLRDATIQRFEFTIELFWKVLKKILAYEKIETSTPRDTLSKAYQYHMIQDEDIWLSMLDDLNNTSHAYKEKEAQIIFEHIKNYMPIFEQTYKELKNKYHL
jgi:hypothetical protein